MTVDEKRKREMDDKVFQKVYIPRSLTEMSLEDIDKINLSKALLPFVSHLIFRQKYRKDNF